MPPARNAAQLTLSLNAVDNVSATTQKVEKRVERYEKAMARARAITSGAIDHIGASFTNFSVAATNVFMALQDQVVAPLKGLLQQFSGAGFGLERLARESRLPIEMLGALGFAAEQTGAKMEDVAGAMQTMEDRIKDASRGNLEAMNDFWTAAGKTYAEMKALSPEERLLAVADVIAKVADEADQAEIARRMFGSDTLLPLLQQGRNAIRKMMAEGVELGAPWSKENIENSKKMAQSWNRINTIFSGIKTSFLSQMTETIEGFLIQTQNILKSILTFTRENPRLVKTFALISAGIVGVMTAGAVLIPVLMGIKIAIGLTAGIATAFLSPWVLIPTAIAAGGAALLQFTGTLYFFGNLAKNVFSSVFEVLEFFFADAIALLGNGEFSAAWENLWSKIRLVFIEWKNSISDYLREFWEYVLNATNQAVNAFLGYLDTIFFGGQEIFGGLWKTVKEYLSGILEAVGASSSSITEIFLACWYQIQKSFHEMTARIRSKWNSFRKDLQAGVNWIYGKIAGLSDEEIGQMTLITDAQFDADKKRIDAEKEENIQAAKSDVEKRIAAGRQKAAEAAEREVETVQRLTRTIQHHQEILRSDAANSLDPSSPDYISGAEGGPANWLNKMVSDKSAGTQNSFQAIFGYGQTTEEKQLDITRQIFQILQAFQAQGVIQ